MYDTDYREHTITALETATSLTEQGADSPGAFVVPTTVRRITEIIISAVPASTVDTIMGFTCAIHVHGAGVILGEGWFPGPAGVIGGGAANSGGSGPLVPQRYLTNIPVKPGGQFTVDGYMLGEDIGALHMLVQIVYDGVPGKIRDMDYRSIDLVTANTLYTLTERGAAIVEGDIRPAYPTIGEIFVGLGAKVTAATATAVGFAVHLSGPGLEVTGNYKFIGPGIAVNDDTVNLNAHVEPLFRYVCGPSGLKTKLNNAIRIQAMCIEGTVTLGFSIVGFAYY